VTSHLIRAGAGFCRQSDADQRALFLHWRQRLDQVMVSHRANNAFIVYFAAYEPPCRRLIELRESKPQASPASGVRRWASLEPFRNWQSEQILRQTEEEGRFREDLERERRAGECSVAGVTAADLVDAFGNDTQMTTSMGKALLVHCSPHVQQAAVQAIRQLPADARIERGKWIVGREGAWYLTLATAYHKLVPMCAPADPLRNGLLRPYNWTCTSQPMPSNPDGKYAYDLIPRRTCGEHCAAAARAIDSYRALLDSVSPFRASVVHSIIAKQCPVGLNGRFLEQLLHLRNALHGVLAALRKALPGLVGVCVVSTRTEPQEATANWETARLFMRAHPEDA